MTRFLTRVFYVDHPGFNAANCVFMSMVAQSFLTLDDQEYRIMGIIGVFLASISASMVVLHFARKLDQIQNSIGISNSQKVENPTTKTLATSTDPV